MSSTFARAFVPTRAESLLYSTVIGALTSYYVVSKLLDDISGRTQYKSTVRIARIVAAALWSTWLTVAMAIGFIKDPKAFYTWIALAVQLAVVLFHGIIRAMQSED
jgi:predicted membrane protein